MSLKVVLYLAVAAAILAGGSVMNGGKKMVEHRLCGKEIRLSAKVCPYCGRKTGHNLKVVYVTLFVIYFSAFMWFYGKLV